jgi:tRNA G18 (ribose-2'-O)-methylase SpoU
MFQDATHALKEVQQTNPMLFRGDKNLMQRQLLEQQKTAKDRLKEANHKLLAYKIKLNKFHETHASMDADKYHQVLMEVLDKKNNAYKELQAILRSH